MEDRPGRRSEHAFFDEGHVPAVEEEVRQLRAENKRRRLERESLNDATARFAGDSSWNLR